MSTVSKKLEQINVKVTPEMKERLEKVADVEGVGLPELVRGWIRAELAAYKIPKSFRQLKEEL